VLIGYVQINFGVIWHFMLCFSDVVDNQKKLGLITKINTDYIIISR